jgi:hypothetical protein
MNADEYRSKEADASRFPVIKRSAIIMFILCIFTFTAPLGSLVSLVWYGIKSADLKKLPALYPGLVKIGIVIGIAQSVLIACAVALYSLLR